MAGLINMFDSEPGMLGLLMLNAARPQAGPRNTGGGLLEVAQGLQQFRAAQDAKKEREQDRAMRQQQFEAQQQQQQIALQQLQRQMAEHDAVRQWRQSIPSPQMGAAQQALSAGGGPTQANAAAMPAVDPLQQLLHSGMQKGAIPIGDYLSTLKPKAPEDKVVGGSLVRVGPGGVQELYRAPQTPGEFTQALIDAGLQPGSPQAQALALQRLNKMATHPAPTSVSVNTGQKGFDNTLKLRGDFRSEPIYKAHQATEAAYGQIRQSLSQASPAGDMAGATKIMKLLDPDSVVRESELAMAMGATGAMDRLTNYADQVVKGVKLNPAQRKDFQLLADKLYSESSRLYNAKRSEYEGIAKRNQLPVEDVLGSPSTPQASNRRVVRTGTQNGRRVVQYDDGSIEHAD